MQYNYSYQAPLAASERIGWKVDDIIGGEKKREFTKPFMHGVNGPGEAAFFSHL